MNPTKTSIPEERLYPVRLLGNGTAAPTVEIGPGITVTRTSAGRYKLAFAKNPGTLVGLRGHAFGAAAPSAAVDLKLVRDTYASNALEILVASPHLKGTVESSNPDSIAAGATGTVTLAITGVEPGDIVMLHPQALDAGLVVESYSVTDDDEVTVTLLNVTDDAVDGGAQTYEYLVLKVTPTDLQADQYLDLTVAFTELG